MARPPSITCEVCGKTSYNREDVKRGWCGKCNAYTGAVPSLIDIGDRFSGMCYDRQGVEITMARWSWLFDQSRFDTYRSVRQDGVDGLWHVSTVWLGINHGIGVPRQIFETMVFLAGTGEDMIMNRYATLEEAVAGHELLVAEISFKAEQAVLNDHTLQHEDRD